jgi:multidrug efflux pump subunit AcrB
MKSYKGLNSTNRTKARKISVKNGFINNRNASRTKMAKAAKKYLEKGVLSPAGICRCCSVLVAALLGGLAVFCFDFISSSFIGTKDSSPVRVNAMFFPGFFIAAYIQNKK